MIERPTVEFLQKVISDAHIGLWEWDPVSNVVYWSPEVYAIFDAPDFDGTLESYESRIHPEDLERLQRAIQEAIERSHAEYRIIHRVIRADRKPCWVESRGTVVRDANGQVERMAGTVWDVTPQLSAEHKLQMALSASNMGLWEWNILGERVIWSKEMAAIYGITPAEFTGTLEDYRARIHPDDWPEIEHRIQCAMADPDYDYYVEHRILRPNGAIRWVEGRGTLVRDEEGQPIRMMGTAWDVTNRKLAKAELEETQAELRRSYEQFDRERRRTEEAVRKSEELLESAGHIAGVGGWEVDLETMYVSWTAETCRIHGVPVGTAPHVDDAIAYYSPESREVIRAHVERALQDGIPYDVELPLIRKDGAQIWVRTEGRAEMENGVAKRLFGVVQDISARRAAEAERQKLYEELLHAKKLESVGRLAGGVAHDFNNIISVILGHAELSLDSLEAGHPLRVELEEIRSAARRSAALTQQLLAFARKQAVSPKVIDLNETVDGMLKMLRRLIGEQITLVWKPGAALKSVLMDPSQVDQILANLCVNARDATDGAGEVLISTSNVQMELGEVPSGEYILLTVKDDGHGIEKETLEHLFEPFFTTKAPGGGTGLGLATVYGIVKQNGGHIRVTSEASQGTEFRIYLPAVDGKMKGTKDSKSEEKLRGGDTILLVEDEPALLKLGRRMLEALGYRVLAAPGPYEALDIADREEGIDLLVTDVIMPRMNGRELMNSLKRIHPELRVLYISGYTAEVIANQGVLEEDVHFLQKPFSMNALSRALAEALGKV